MNKIIATLLVFAALFMPTIAQNLVPNSSFETFSNCPSNTHQIYLAIPWDTPYLNGAQGEYFNVCASNSGVGVPMNLISLGFGFQNAHTGNAYAGFNAYSSLAYFHQFIQVKLIDTLSAGSNYCLKYFVNLLNKSFFGVDGIGAYFSDTLFNCNNSTCLIGLNPQVSNPIGNTITDTLNWTAISGCFTATGNETYLIIGNFLPDSLTTKEQVNTGTNWSTYYYIDDVSLWEDTALALPETKSQSVVTISPNPASNTFSINNASQEQLESFWIEDMNGRMIKKIELSGAYTLADISTIENGVYIYHCKFKSEASVSGKLIILH